MESLKENCMFTTTTTDWHTLAYAHKSVYVCKERNRLSVDCWRRATNLGKLCSAMYTYTRTYRTHIWTHSSERLDDKLQGISFPCFLSASSGFSAFGYGVRSVRIELVLYIHIFAFFSNTYIHTQMSSRKCAPCGNNKHIFKVNLGKFVFICFRITSSKLGYGWANVRDIEFFSNNSWAMNVFENVI